MYVHKLDPVLLNLGPFQIRWYGLMYLVGFVTGYLLMVRRFKRGQFVLNPEQIQNLITFIMIGMMIGARLVYVVVYNPMHYLENPSEIPAIWHGGLSFHGAALGFIGAVIIFCRKYGFKFYQLMDTVVLGSAQGIFFGRLGNFINGELAGRVTDVPWGIVFPEYGVVPRHPSQLYQAFCEGLGVLLVLYFIEWRERKKGYAPQIIKEPRKQDKKGRLEPLVWKRTGVLSTWFLILYGIGRFIVEFFREPDAQLGYFFGWMTMGQILCSLMILAGAYLLYRVVKKPIEVQY